MISRLREFDDLYGLAVSAFALRAGGPEFRFWAGMGKMSDTGLEVCACSVYIACETGDISVGNYECVIYSKLVP